MYDLFLTTKEVDNCQGRVAGGERDRVLGRKGRGSREKAVGFVGQKGTGFLREREGLKGEPQVFHS